MRHLHAYSIQYFKSSREGDTVAGQYNLKDINGITSNNVRTTIQLGSRCVVCVARSIDPMLGS
jgi:hypothetical protein